MRKNTVSFCPYLRAGFCILRILLRSYLTVGKTFGVTVAANDQREKAREFTHAASDSD